MEDTKKHEAQGTAAEEQLEQEQETASEDQSLQELYDSTNKQLVRISADFANYRRRTESDRVTWMRSGSVSAVKALLPLVDDIERAVSAARCAAADDVSDATKSVVEGLELLEKNMIKVLKALKVEEISGDGDFDPHKHEALVQVPDSGKESGAIVAVLEKGYILDDVVVRHAKVSVAA
jgi:molecular chaperone GrpE